MDVSYSLVIPSYNEEGRIGDALKSYIKYFESTYQDYEIIVVCDGCHDSTEDIVKNFSVKNSNILCVAYSDRLGKGGAIQTGLNVAKGRVIGFIDADDAFELQYLKEFFDLLEDGQYDCVIASKWKGKHFWSVKEPLVRKTAGRVWNLLSRILFSLNFHDTQGGMKFLRKKAWDDIGGGFETSGFEFDVELLWRLKKHKFKVFEIYVPSKHREGSTFNLKNSLDMFIHILKIRL